MPLTRGWILAVSFMTAIVALGVSVTGIIIIAIETPPMVAAPVTAIATPTLVTREDPATAAIALETIPALAAAAADVAVAVVPAAADVVADCAALTANCWVKPL